MTSDPHLLQTGASIDLRELVDVEGGWIDRRLFWDKDIYQAELARIFARCWLFVAHESQLPSVGDFLTTYMGEDSVIVTRDRAGVIQVLLNSCAHRGNRICFAECGNAKRFTCNYHGWSYGLDGALLGMFLEQFYEQTPGFCKGDISLLKARVATHKGLVFATFDQEAPSLDDYLGDFRWYLDVLLDNDPGGTEFLDGCIKSRVDCNWKFPAENFVGDALHAGWTHASAINAIFGKNETPLYDETYHANVNGHGYEFALDLVGNAAVLGYREIVNELRAREKEVAERLGALRSRMTGGLGSATVFPNFSFLPGHQTFRTWQPKGPTKTEIHTWVLVNRSLSEQIKDMYREGVMRTFSPSGVLEMDDGENWEHATQANAGYVARQQKLHYGLGLGSEIESETLPGHVHRNQVNDANQRAFYARWLDFMTNPAWPAVDGAR